MKTRLLAIAIGIGIGMVGPGMSRADKAAHDCAKTPTASINDGAGSYKFIGACTRIVINGGANTVSIESVQELSVTGAENTVTIGSVDKITAAGNDNKISYRKGIAGAKPKVTSIGEHNTINQLK